MIGVEDKAASDEPSVPSTILYTDSTTHLTRLARDRVNKST